MREVRTSELRIGELRKVIDFVKDNVIVTLSDANMYDVKRKEKEEKIVILTEEFNSLGNETVAMLVEFNECIKEPDIKEKVNKEVEYIKDTMLKRLSQLQDLYYFDESGFDIFISLQNIFIIISKESDYWWQLYQINKNFFRLFYLAKEIYMLT